MRAAAAFASLGGPYREPHHVVEVRKDGRVVWRAPDPADIADQTEVRPSGASLVLLDSAVDDGGQWAWSVARAGGTATAVALFATEADGKRNRRLDGMSPLPGSVEETGSGSGESRTNLAARLLMAPR
jgi:hypothetical protein